MEKLIKIFAVGDIQAVELEAVFPFELSQTPFLQAHIIGIVEIV